MVIDIITQNVPKNKHQDIFDTYSHLDYFFIGHSHKKGHLRNVYKTGELKEEGTTEKYSVVQTEGDRKVRRELNFYNLGMIISVGYRVNSIRGTQFRIWATQILKERMLKGYSLHKRLLQEQPKKMES